MKKRYWLIFAFGVLFVATFLALLLLPTDTPPPTVGDSPTNATEESEKGASVNATSEETDEMASDGAPSSDDTATNEETTEAQQSAPSESLTEIAVMPSERENVPSESLTQEPTHEEALIQPQALVYTVSVLDCCNRPLSGVTVRIMKNGLLVSEKQTQNGVASFFLPPDGYEIDFDLTDTPYFYDSNALIPLFEESPSAHITLYDRPEDIEEINAYSPKEGAFRVFEAKRVTLGGSHAKIPALDRAYFLFTPSEQGEYLFRLDCECVLTIGYFGIPDFLQKDSITPPNDENSFTLTVRDSMIGNTYVIGVTSYEDADFSCVLHIERTGDAAPLPADLPFLHIEAQSLPDKAFHYKIGGTVTDLDISANPSVFFNESDGLYHLGEANGPTVYMRMTSASPYLDAIATVATKTGLSRYFYDESGNFERKEQYNSLFLAYAEIADPNEGVVPLTKELADAFKNAGEGMGWWQYGAANYLFGATPVKKENAWLFACCTVNSD